MSEKNKCIKFRKKNLIRKNKKKILEKHFEEQVGKKIWKRIYAQGMLPLQRSQDKNNLNNVLFRLCYPK